MSRSPFDGALSRVLAHEGGFTDDKRDPGGATNFGITIADYRKYVKPDATVADVRAMRVEEARAIYRAHYWDALDCDALPAGVDESVFDYGVNSGVGRAGRVLRRVLGLPDDDWRVTAAVLAACARREAAAVVRDINDERLRFLKSLRTWPVFGTGWQRRVADVRASSLALAAAALRPQEDRGTVGSDGAPRVPSPPPAPVAVAAGAAGGMGAGALVPLVAAHPRLAVLLAALAVAVAAAAAWRWLRRARRIVADSAPQASME